MRDFSRRGVVGLVGGAAASWPLAAHAQQPARVPIIGVLAGGTPSSHGQLVAALLKRLRELGWTEGRTAAIEVRWAEGRVERFAEIATEFSRLKVDVIVTSGLAVPAVRQAASTIPPQPHSSSCRRCMSSEAGTKPTSRDARLNAHRFGRGLLSPPNSVS